MQYSRARDLMLRKTDTRFAPWWIIRSDDKRKARLNTIAHLLSQIPHKKLPHDKVKLPGRSRRAPTTTTPPSRAGDSYASATEDALRLFRPSQPQLGESRLERRRREAEPFRGAAGAANAPAGRFEHGADVLFLDISELWASLGAAVDDCGTGIVRRRPVAVIIARSTTLRSSRMLPGHE